MCKWVPRAEANLKPGPERLLVALLYPGWSKPEVVPAQYFGSPGGEFVTETYGFQSEGYVTHVMFLPDPPA